MSLEQFAYQCNDISFHTQTASKVFFGIFFFLTLENHSSVPYDTYNPLNFLYTVFYDLCIDLCVKIVFLCRSLPRWGTSVPCDAQYSILQKVGILLILYIWETAAAYH